MLTTVLSTADPAAAAAGTWMSWASFPIAAICQTFPGTYLPRFDTHQMRVASPNEMRADQAARMRRQTSMRSAYVPSTTTPDAAMYDHFG